MGEVFCEDVIRFPLKGDHMKMIGTTYGDPYLPAIMALEDEDDPGVNVDSFGWSVGRSFGRRLYERGLRWEQVWSLAIKLTPDLETRQVGRMQRGESANSTIGVSDYSVEVGLSPELWAQTSVLGKRTLLAELGTEAMRSLAAHQGWEIPEDVFQVVMQSFRDDEDDLPWVAGTTSDVVELPREVYDSLSLDVWESLDEAKRTAVVEEITRALSDSGRALRSLGQRGFGPKRAPLVVAQWCDEATGVPFSLICGGTFSPGYRREQIRQAHIDHEASYDDDEDRPALRPRRPKVIHPYQSQLPCNLGRKPPVKVAPFLLASEPMLCGTPDLERSLDLSKTRHYYPFKGEPAPNQGRMPFYVMWSEVATLLRRYRWSLPSSAEFEWSLRGGRDTLYYWGERPPDAASPRVMGPLSFDFEHPHAWPWCNRFGLAAPLIHRTWCLPRADPDEAFPLISRGGTESYPGQECGEWWLFCSAVECRECLDDDFNFGRVLRPSIRFRPEHCPRRSGAGRRAD